LLPVPGALVEAAILTMRLHAGARDRSIKAGIVLDLLYDFPLLASVRAYAVETSAILGQIKPHPRARSDQPVLEFGAPGAKA
jgi:hypothetical protein